MLIVSFWFIIAHLRSFLYDLWVFRVYEFNYAFACFTKDTLNKQILFAILFFVSCVWSLILVHLLLIKYCKEILDCEYYSWYDIFVFFSKIIEFLGNTRGRVWSFIFIVLVSFARPIFAIYHVIHVEDSFLEKAPVLETIEKKKPLKKTTKKETPAKKFDESKKEDSNDDKNSKSIDPDVAARESAKSVNTDVAWQKIIKQQWGEALVNGEISLDKYDELMDSLEPIRK